MVLQAGRCAVQLGPGVLASDGRRVAYTELTAAQVRELDRDRSAFADPGRLLDRADRTVDLTERARAAIERTSQGLRRREKAVAARERELDEEAATVRQQRADLDAEADRIAQQIEAVRTAFDRQVQEFADQRAAMEHAAYLQAKGANAEIAQLRAEIERLERRIGGARRGGGAGSEPDPLPRREPGRYGPGLN
jgi:chromosome segregation ATPase